MRSLWGELRRRHVVRVAISYVIVAIGIGAAADVFFPGLGAPAWALSTVLVLLVLGLPLAVVSEDPANEYFSDGVTEDILTHLSRIADLHVISRTSVMVCTGSTASVGQIARELRVGTVLEGSVRKVGDYVRGRQDAYTVRPGT